VLVAIGVAGELGVDVKAGTIRTDLRTKNGELIQLLQGTSSAALGKAADANERSKVLEGSNLQSRKDLSAMETRLVAEQIKLQKQQQITAKAQKDAADAQSEFNTVLARRAFGRHANPELFKELKNLPKARAEIWYKHDDGEAHRFAVSIAGLLGPKEAGGIGWDVPPPVPRPEKEGEPPLSGNRIFARTLPSIDQIISRHPTSVYVLLSRAVGTSGGWYGTALPENVFRIEIGESVFPFDELLQGPLR
jgi:hypothetical protein